MDCVEGFHVQKWTRNDLNSSSESHRCLPDIHVESSVDVKVYLSLKQRDSKVGLLPKVNRPLISLVFWSLSFTICCSKVCVLPLRFLSPPQTSVDLCGINWDHRSPAHSVWTTLFSQSHGANLKEEGLAYEDCACAGLFWAPSPSSDTAAPTGFRDHFWRRGSKHRTITVHSLSFYVFI